MLKIQINHNLRCEVDQGRDDCRRERPHCHITRNGIRVAQVWLNPVWIETGADLSHSERDIVLAAVRAHKCVLEQEYLNNANKKY